MKSYKNKRNRKKSVTTSLISHKEVLVIKNLNSDEKMSNRHRQSVDGKKEKSDKIPTDRNHARNTLLGVMETPQTKRTVEINLDKVINAISNEPDMATPNSCLKSDDLLDCYGNTDPLPAVGYEQSTSKKEHEVSSLKMRKLKILFGVALKSYIEKQT